MKLNGVYQNFAEYYRNVLPFSTIYKVYLNPNDTLIANPDPTGLKYILNVSEPVFLAPNKHYVFGFVTPITEEKKYYPRVSEALIKIIKAHNTLNAPAGSSLTAREQRLVNSYAGYKTVAYQRAYYDSVEADLRYFKLYVSYLKKILKPRDLKVQKNTLKQKEIRERSVRGMPKQADALKIQIDQIAIADWDTIYKQNYVRDTNAKKDFLDAMQAYTKVYSDMGKEYQINTIPSNLYDYGILGDRTFYQVYKLALDLAPIYNKMLKFAQKIDSGTNLNYAGNPCLTKIAEYAAACNCCPGTAPGDCGLLKDTTGFINFVTGLVKPDAQNSLKNFFDSAKVRLATPAIFPLTLQNIIDTLNLAKSYFSQIRNLILFHAVAGDKACMDSLLNLIAKRT